MVLTESQGSAPPPRTSCSTPTPTPTPASTPPTLPHSAQLLGCRLGKQATPFSPRGLVHSCSWGSLGCLPPPARVPRGAAAPPPQMCLGTDSQLQSEAPAAHLPLRPPKAPGVF